MRLSGRYGFAALTHLRLVAFAQFGDEFVHPGGLGRSQDRFRVRFRFETRDILRHRPRKEFNILRQIADVSAEHLGRPLVEGTSIKPNLASRWWPYSDQQACKRGLARAGRADHAESVAALELEGYILQHELGAARWRSARILQSELFARRGKEHRRLL